MTTRLAIAISIALLGFGCGDYGGSRSKTTNEAPAAAPLGPVAGSNPAVGKAAFEQNVYPLLTQYCGGTCHVGRGEGQPFIAHPDVDTAYHEVVDNQKVNLSAPDRSRLVRRLVADFHHCWSNCAENGAEMQAAIEVWAQMIADAGPPGGGEQVDAIITAPRRLADGIEDLGSERYSNHLIAFWDFKEGSGAYAHDTSGIVPQMNLQLDGPAWMSNYGISIETGDARAVGDSSRKLYDHIASPDTGTQQYTVEAWLVPDNVDQEGPARILGYSQGTGQRNFGLGQVLYTYDFRNRSVDPGISGNGTPSLRTYDGDEDLQATLQHVVISYDQIRGRRIYVNSRWTDDEDEIGATRLWNWDERYRFILGNETSGDRQWVGKIQLVAIYEAALTDAQIRQNFDAGVGKRLVLRFDLAQWLGAGSYLEFQVSELDDYSYLFCKPAIVTANPSGFQVKNLRVSVNGQVSVSGQAFTTIDQIVTSTRQELSATCSIVPKDQGAAGDAFALEFEVLGGFEDPIVVGAPPAPPPEVFGAALPTEGVRDFSRLNETMAAVTGVDPNDPSVRATFAELEQQLPGGPDLRAFSSSYQVGIAKLALEYCDRMVDTPALRDAFFGTNPAFDWNADATQAFSPTMRAVLIQGLVDGMLGSGLANQPSVAEASPVLEGLFDDLTAGCTPTTCGADRTRSIVKGACAAVLGSAGASIH